MKILHITNLYPIKSYSAYGIFIKEQINSLNELGFINDIFFINAREFGKIQYVKCIKEIRKKVKNYDLIHCHHVYSATTFLLCGSRKPYIVSILGDICNGRGVIDKIMFKIHQIFSKKIIYKNNLAKITPKMLQIPNGVNMELFRPIDKILSKNKINLDPSKKYVLFVTAAGVTNKIKRYDKFKDVLNNLRTKGYELESLILSGIEREKVPYYYNSSEILLMTSDHEGSPNAVKEAMSCNLPVVSTDVGNVSDMLDGCEGSFVSSSKTVENLTNLCIKCLESSNFTGRETIINKKLDIDSIAQKLSDLYKEME